MGDNTKGFNGASAASAPREVKQKFFEAAIGNDAMTVLQTVMTYKDATSWKSNEGLTALMYAAQAGNKETAWVLCHAPGDLELGNDNDSTALMFASHAGKASIVAMLLEAGAGVNHANNSGHTALMSAAANGYKNTAEQLLKYNADVTMKDKDGNTAADYARENKVKAGDSFEQIGTMIAEAAVTQQAEREKAAAEAKARGGGGGAALDDTTRQVQELEKKLVKAKLVG